jgi:hypothetical protein
MDDRIQVDLTKNEIQLLIMMIMIHMNKEKHEHDLFLLLNHLRSKLI